MSSFQALRPTPTSTAVAAMIVQALVALQVLAAPAANAETREATPFAVPSGSPDEYMRAAARFARQLDSNVEISY